MQGRMSVKQCLAMHITSTTPIICGFERWCDRSCRSYPKDVTAMRIDPAGHIQVRILGSRQWIRKEQWMDDKEAWNCVEDWELDDERDSNEIVRIKETGDRDVKKKNVTVDMRDENLERQNGVYDEVLFPKHYASGSIECIDAMKAFLDCSNLTPYQGFLAGTMFKYLWRFNAKGRPVQDLEKLDWYRERLIKTLG